MKFSTTKDNILQYVQYANSFTSNKPFNTYLQNIYMEVNNEILTIKATNHETGFSSILSIDSKENGVLTVSGKKLYEIIKELPDGALIEFNYDGSRLNIKSGRSEFKLSTLSPESFPTMSEIKSEFYLEIDSKEFINILKKVSFCISTDVQKIEYTGAMFEIKGNTLEIFATGLQRVAIASMNFKTEFADEFLINIPKKTIIEIIRIFEATDTIEIETDKHQISFKSKNIIIYSKLIEKFVKGISRLFNDNYPIKAKLERKNFIEALKRVSTITSEETPGVMLNFTDNSLKMSSLETEYGQGFETIDDIKCTVDNFEIILNAKHSNEILNSIDTDYFELEMKDKRSPALITPESKNYRYLIVPISIDKI